MPNQYTARPVAERFWEKVDRHGPIPVHRPELGPCWVWTASVNRNGYGRFAWQIDGKRIHVEAHLWAYRDAIGAIGKALVLDHLCRVRRCVRVSHLEPVVVRVNVLRGAGPAAINVDKVVCKRGHPFNEANTYVWRRHRICRTCRLHREAAYRRLG